MTFDPVLMSLKDNGFFFVQKPLPARLHMAVMRLHTLSLRALLLLGFWQTGRRSLASVPELKEQPKKIGKPVFTCKKQQFFTA